MSEKYFTAGDKKITLRPVDDVVVVRYKKSLGDTGVQELISSKPLARIEGVNIKTYPKYNIALVTRPPAENAATRENFSSEVGDDENIEFISRAYREVETGSLMVVTDEINIKFKKGITKESINELITSKKLSIIEGDEEGTELTSNPYLVKVKDANGDNTVDTANALSSLPEVEYAEPNFVTEFKKENVSMPNGRFFAEQWHLHNGGQGNGMNREDVDALNAWKISKGGSSSVKIAIIDDGVDTNQPDLKANIWENPDPNAADRHGKNFFDGTDDPNPIHFAPPFDQMTGNDIHGTPCAGVAAAAGEDASGVCGIAFECKIIGVKVWGADDLAPNSQIAKAIRYAGKHADILSCSWSSGPSNVVSDAIKDVARNGRKGLGCPIFVATGNSAPSPISFPARLPEAIAVGASTNTGLRAGYSQFGPEIDFLAPSSGGTRGIFTTDVSIPTRGFNIGRRGQGDPEGLYTNGFGGTSSATPLAAGIGALVISENPTLTSEQIRIMLRNCCDKIDPNNANYNASGFSKTHGFGRLNARRALELAKNGSRQ